MFTAGTSRTLCQALSGVLYTYDFFSPPQQILVQPHCLYEKNQFIKELSNLSKVTQVNGGAEIYTQAV